jgi:hypothetical protein
MEAFCPFSRTWKPLELNPSKSLKYLYKNDFLRHPGKVTDNELSEGIMLSGHFRVMSWNCLQRLAGAFTLLATLGCNPSGLPDSASSSAMDGAESANSEKLTAPVSEKSPDFEVKLRISTQTAAALAGRGSPNKALQLTASLVEFSVKNCASGYTLTGIGSAQDSFQLYRYDQSCKVWLESFALEGQIFTPMPGETFNPDVNAETQFLGDAGRILIVRVAQQLPHILDTLDAQASFLIVEKSLGNDFNIKVYAVGLSSSTNVLVESATTTLPITIRRGLPAEGTLRVPLEVSGTASLGTDIVGVPNEVEFQDGVSEITFNIQALTDDPYDDLETLEISIQSGPYFIVDPSLNLSIRDQSYRPPVWTQTASNQTVLDDMSLSFSVKASDPDGDPVYYSIDAARSTCVTGWLTPISITQSGDVSGVPGDAAIGSCLLALTVTSLGGMISHDVSITVLDRSESPVWTQIPSTVRVYEGESLDVSFVATDPDPGANVSYSIDPASSCLGYAWNPAPTIGSSSGRLQGRPATEIGGRCIFIIRAQSQGITITTDFQLEIARRTLVWSAPSGTPEDTCIPVSLLLSDGLDQYIDAVTTSNISLLVNNGSGTFYDRSTCTSSSAISSISWPAGVSELSFYFRSNTSNQNLTLVAQGGTYEPGYFTILVSTSISRLIVGGPSRIGVNQCAKYRVDQASSTYVKVAGTSNRTVSFNLNGGMRAYSDKFCTDQISTTVIPAYETGTDFYIRAPNTGNRTIRVTASGLTSGQMSVQILTSRPWWNSGWVHRLPIQIDNSDQNVVFSNQPVLVRLTPDRFPYLQAKADGSDLRFVNSLDSLVLPHQIEQWVPGGTSLIWVRVDQIPARSSLGMIHLYFGNAGAGQAEQPETLWSSYAGVWHLSESPVHAAPQFKDSTSQGRHGRAVSGVQSLQGPIGSGLSFMGTLDHVELTGFDLAPILGRTATFSAWVKTEQTGSNIGWSSPALTGVENFGTTNDIQYGWLDQSGLIGVTAGDSGAAKSNFSVNDNTWRHVTITRNESTGAVAFYVNGVESGTGTSEAGFKSTAFNRFGVLWDTSGTHRDFNGFMDEIRITTGILSADRIRADYKYMIDSHLNYLFVEDY